MYLFIKQCYNKHINDTRLKQNLNIVYTIITSIHDICTKANLQLQRIRFSLHEKNKRLCCSYFAAKKKKHVNVFVFEWLYNKYINDTCTKQNLNIVYTIITSINDICTKANLLHQRISYFEFALVYYVYDFWSLDQFVCVCMCACVRVCVRVCVCVCV